jgi:hypothetical protein
MMLLSLCFVFRHLPSNGKKQQEIHCQGLAGIFLSLPSHLIVEGGKKADIEERVQSLRCFCNNVVP